ncbi:MAG TPA: carboxypeptidase-like regulatory domain-containing protein, partial [Thermoanaerobaculia bacterium]
MILVSVANAYADIYGSISGTVRDNNGNPLPGVTVSAAAPVLPKARDTVTESNGTYLLPSLPPGTYTVNATLAGLGSAQTNAVVVVVDKQTAVDLRLSPTVSEAITVTAAAPTVDMKSTEVNYNYDA